MQPMLEAIPISKGESFNLLQWSPDNVTDLVALGSNGRTQSIKGMGDTWHSHPRYELLLVMQGTGTRLVGDHITQFKEKDLVLMGPNLPHCWHPNKRYSGYALQFDYNPDLPLWQVPELHKLESLFKKSQKGIYFNSKVADEVLEAISAMPTDSPVARMARFLKVFDLLQQSVNTQASTLSTKAFPALQKSDDYQGIQNAIQIILNSYQQKLPLEDILKATSMSKATFQRKFKYYTERNFTRFLIEVRMDAVKRRLIETDSSISDIVFDCGFNNLSNFNHTFAKMFGEPPNVFRSRMKQGT